MQILIFLCENTIQKDILSLHNDLKEMGFTFEYNVVDNYFYIVSNNKAVYFNELVKLLETHNIDYDKVKIK